MPLTPTETSSPVDLAPLGCVDDNDTGPESCAVSTDGLRQAAELVVSPDGRNVYATSGYVLGDQAVVEFARDPATGALTPLGCIDDVTAGADTCARSAVGLNGATGIAVSPDGASVYVVSENSNALVRFDRDPATGLLTPIDCVSDPDPTGDSTPPAACAQSTNGLDVARSVAVSSDGLSVYVSSYNDSALVRFRRDPTTGAVTPIGCIDDTTTGADTCDQSTIGLSGASGNSAVALDPHGDSLYVAASDDDDVAMFSRDRSTKGIASIGCVGDNDTGADPCSVTTDGLTQVSALTLSPDGDFLYATSEVDGALVTFSRDQSTGLLTPNGCIDGPSDPDTCAQSAFGLSNSYAVAAAPDGRAVYTVARAGYVVGFSRDPATGGLTAASCVHDNERVGGPSCLGVAPALDNSIDIAVSPDGRSLYATSEGDDAIQIFGIDPPETSLLAAPASKTRHRLAVFRFSSDEPSTTFACSLDDRPFVACSSPVRMRVKRGAHRFAVAATDALGNPDTTPAEYRWRVRRPR